ncbi:MAG: hypothetical protein HQL31_13820 [Planctomycetes bacterium]|nr:hypothetical protein [Planctomycetota bacterium]
MSATSLIQRGWRHTPGKWRVLLSLAFSELLWKGFDSAYGIVDSWVSLAREFAGEQAASLTNAILRKLCRVHEKTPMLPVDFLPVPFLSQWQNANGILDDAVKWLMSPQKVFWHAYDKDAGLAEMPGRPLPWEGGVALVLEEGRTPQSFMAECSDRGFIQNLTQARICKRIHDKLGGRLLDYCSAPGGKAWQLARLSSGTLSADLYDINPRRRARLGASPALGIFRGLELLADGDLKPGSYPDLLIDVPCSNSGVLSKSPEAMRHCWGGPDAFAAVQEEILAKAVQMVAPSGRIHYTTCSISPAENENRLNSFAQTNGFRMTNQEAFSPNATGAHGGYWGLLEKDENS